MDTMLINQEQVMELVTIKDIVDSVEKTFRGMGSGTVINPTKLTLDLGETGAYPHFEGYMNAMPAYVEWADTAGIKWAGGFLGERKKKDLPYITSMIMLIDPRVGNFTAMMDGAYITNMRTGAQTAIAMQYLFPEDKKNISIGLYGAGMQGQTQIMAISQRFTIDKVYVYDVNADMAKTYRERVKDYVSGEVVIADTPEQAATGDAIISVTHASNKFIQNSWVKPGTIVFPMGSHQECADDLILSMDKIIVDHMGQALHRGALADVNAAGKVTEKDVFATIGELAAGKKEARLAPNERYLCVPIGTGCMDIGVASIVLERAKEKGLGQPYNFV